MKEAARRRGSLLHMKAQKLLVEDYVFGGAIALVVGGNLYFVPRIKRERVAMQ